MHGQRLVRIGCQPYSPDSITLNATLVICEIVPRPSLLHQGANTIAPTPGRTWGNSTQRQEDWLTRVLAFGNDQLEKTLNVDIDGDGQVSPPLGILSLTATFCGVLST